MEKRSKIKWRIKGSNGLELFVHTFPSEENPKGIVCLVHGHGEHIERYEHLAKRLNDANYSMIGFDLRGHGQSDGRRGHTPSYNAMMEDIDLFLAEVDEHYAGLPRFLYGHSMGGNLVLNYAMRRNPDLKGVIATGPWLKLAFEPPAIQVGLAKLMQKLFPAFTQSSGLATDALSRDPEVVRAYEEDPYVHDKLSARLFTEIHSAGLWALAHAAEFPLPLLLMHGGADRITSAEASKEFAEKAEGKTLLKIWEGFYHEIHNEPEKEDVFKTLIDWMGAL